MLFAPRLSRHERTVLGRLRLLGLEGETTIRPRAGFRDDLRSRLLAEAACETGCNGEPALAGC